MGPIDNFSLVTGPNKVTVQVNGKKVAPLQVNNTHALEYFVALKSN